MIALVAYVSKHGSTQSIAERIAEKLRKLGKQAGARPVDEVTDPGSYHAFVIGSASGSAGSGIRGRLALPTNNSIFYLLKLRKVGSSL